MARQVDKNSAMRVSRYETASSWLLALNLMVGFFVALMFLIWLTTIIMFFHEPVPVRAFEPKGRGEAAKGYERDIEEPGLEEIEDMTEPRIEETFEAVTDAVSSTKAALTSMETGATSSSYGTGMGDSRAAGPGGEGNDDVIPPWERWDIRLTARDPRTFGRLLDALGIEIGVFGGGDPNKYYCSNFSTGLKTRSFKGVKTTPGRRPPPGVYVEKRLYFAPTDPNAKQFTLYWVDRAKIERRGKSICHFYPDATVQTLLNLESKRAGNKGLDEVKKTVFGVRYQGGKPSFYVISQRYRRVNRL